MLNLLQETSHKDIWDIPVALTTNIIYRRYDIMGKQSVPNKSGSRKKKDIVGQRFGRLLVVKNAGRSKNGHVKWKCLCDCGKTCIVFGSNLRREHTRSCGCIWNEAMTKHGMCHTPTYSTWQHMIDRCNNPNYIHYFNYGGRGIHVCRRWLKFENFFKDMGFKPKGLTIERTNNNLGYFKENCCYASSTVQNRNQRVQRRNTTGVTGVTWDKHRQKYHASVGLNYKRIHLGYFEDINDAIQARKDGELKYWEKTEE